MTVHLHHLTGCAPAPLAHYLKALGVLRLIARQKDSEARGFWKDEHFCLLTSLDRAALEKFFLDEYEPTPAFNPWGARSGFYPGSSERTARLALQTIEATDNDRLASFRAGIARVRAAIGEAGGGKPDDEDSKASLLSALRADLRGSASEWLDTVMAVVAGAFRPPAIIGSGGNEGSGSYLSAYLQAVVEVVLSDDRTTRARQLCRTLFLAPNDTAQAAVRHAWGGSFGQFMPDGDGSAWDFLLCIEGAIVFRSAVTLRSGAESGARFLASPFYLPHEAVGAGSDAPVDEFAVNKGRLNPGRGEQWFPIWEAPTSASELASVIAEGRCSIGRRNAGRPLDAMRAIGQFGVARGLSAFIRYGYLQRNNLALHFAVPLGRVEVLARPQARLLRDIDGWMRRLRREARGKRATSRLVIAERNLANAAFNAAQGASPGAWRQVLLTCAAVEALQVTGTGIAAGPIPRLSAGWLDAARDDSPEWRLAIALGSAAADHRRRRPDDPVRAHVLPLDRDRYAVKEKRLVRSARVVMSGRDAIADLVALVERRLIEATQHGQRALPLVARPGAGAQLADLAAFIEGRVDAARTLWLARALMAVRWDEAQLARRSLRPGSAPAEAWQALRLCGLPFDVAGRRVPIDAAMVRRLASGDATGAITIALRRLSGAGLRPPIATGIADPATARRWAAALAFPIDTAVAEAMARHFQNHVTTETA